MWNWIKKDEEENEPFFESLIGCHNSFNDDCSSEVGQFKKFNSRSSRTVNYPTQQSLPVIEEAPKLDSQDFYEYAYKKKETSVKEEKKAQENPIQKKDTFTFAENALGESQPCESSQAHSRILEQSSKQDANMSAFSSSFQSFLKDERDIDSLRQSKVTSSARYPIYYKKSLPMTLANKIKMHRNNYESLRFSRVAPTPEEPKINIRNSQVVLNTIPEEPEKKASQKDYYIKPIRKPNELYKAPNNGRMSLVDLIKIKKAKKTYEISASKSKKDPENPSKNRRYLTPYLAAILSEFELKASEKEQISQPPYATHVPQPQSFAMPHLLQKKSIYSKHQIFEQKASQKSHEIDPDALKKAPQPLSTLPNRLMYRLMLQNDESRKPNLFLRKSIVGTMFYPKQPSNPKHYKTDNASIMWLRYEEDAHNKYFYDKYSKVTEGQISLQVNRVRIDNLRRILEEYKRELEQQQVVSQIQE